VTTADVPTARSVTIAVTLNGVVTDGTLDIQPLGVQSMTVSPPSVHAGSGSSITLQLNRAPAAGLIFHFTSSDPTVIPAPANLTFPGGAVTQLVPVTTLSPQSTTKTVTITATATRQTVFGAATITQTATVTVTP
jgi:hypothetical protein